MASDGVWDNLFDDDITAVLSRYMPDEPQLKMKNTQAAADEIALRAEDLGNTNGYWSPFAVEASKHYQGFMPRGKPDDVTVIVAQMHNRQESDGNKYIQTMQGSGFSKPYYERVSS